MTLKELLNEHRYEVKNLQKKVSIFFLFFFLLNLTEIVLTYRMVLVFSNDFIDIGEKLSTKSDSQKSFSISKNNSFPIHKRFQNVNNVEIEIVSKLIYVYKISLSLLLI